MRSVELNHPVALLERAAERAAFGSRDASVWLARRHVGAAEDSPAR
jgi:hypothetical protein